MPARESFRSSNPPDSKCSTSAVVAQLRKIAARALPKLRVSAAAATIRVSRGALAQLVRAPPCHGGGCGFEPRRLRGFCNTFNAHFSSHMTAVAMDYRLKPQPEMT